MGFWNFIYSIRDRVQGITPDLSTVKRAGGTTYDYTSTAAAKIEKVVRVDGIQNLPQYLPDSETKAQMGIFTTTLAKNAGKYAVTEGFKHIPGATVVTKLISDTMREVKQETDKDQKKVKADRPEEDSRLSKSKPETVSQNGKLSLQSADKRGVKGCAAYSYSSAAAAKINQVFRVDGIEKLPQYLPDSGTRAQIGHFTTKLAKNAGKTVVSEGFKHIPGATVATKLISDTMREVKQETNKDGMKAKVIRLEEDFRSSKSQPEIVSQNGHLILQNAHRGANKAKDMINMFMVTEFVQNHMVRDIMVSKIACKEKKNEEKSIKGDVQSLEDLTYEKRKEFLKKYHLQKNSQWSLSILKANISPAVLATLSRVAHTELPTFSPLSKNSTATVLPVVVPLGATLAACAQLLLTRYGEKSDGLVTCRDAEVPGSVVVHPSINWTMLGWFTLQ